MREINLNGYIDDEVWFGDEITPESLHELLYGKENQYADDVHIRLNSYGGSCNAATRMFDDILAYPGNVRITVSGTAASAATVLSMAADKLEMTPGSLWMIHDPSTIAWGDERDLLGAIDLLRACKESILNVYGRRCGIQRDDVAALMTATTWMDAQSALAYGFIDAITENVKSNSPQNAEKPHTVNREDAEKKVKAWFDRHIPRKPKLSRPVEEVEISEVSHASHNAFPTDENPPIDTNSLPDDDHTSAVPPDDEQANVSAQMDGTAQLTELTEPYTTDPPVIPGTPIAQLHKRLGLIKPAKRSK